MPNPEVHFTVAKALILPAIIASLLSYSGALIIALIASLVRLAYTKESASFDLFIRFFFMSLGITLLMVSVGKLQGWGEDTLIVASGISAFLSREILDILIESRRIMLKIVVRKFGGLDD